MKSQVSSMLFVLMLSACGGDREAPTVSMSPTDFLPKLPMVSPDAMPQPAVTQPMQPTPVVVEHVVPTKFDDALALGRELAAKGDNAGAKEMFEAAIKLDKKQAEPHIELSRLYITMKERGLAIAAANKAVKLAPLSSQAWNTKGRAELNRFDYDAAIEAFSKAVELNQDNVWAWNNLGYTELTLKKYDEAVEHLTEATSRNGAASYMWNNLGTALEKLGRLDEARTAYDHGGGMGSKEAVASRKRLEGVKSVAVAKINDDPKPEVRAEGTKTYDLTDEGDTDEDRAMEESKGQGGSDQVDDSDDDSDEGDGSGSGSANDKSTL